MESPADIAALRAFLFKYIESYEQLEALLRLYRSPQPLTILDLSAELKVDSADIERAVEGLSDSKLVIFEVVQGQKRFRYSAPPELVADVQRLAAVHRDQHVKLVEMMTANAIHRVRTNALRVFADGFRFRGPKKNG